MKRIDFKVFLVCFFAGTCFFAKAQDVDVLHYRYEISLSDDNDSIQGLATIKMVKKSDAPQVAFDLAGVKKNRGMVVNKVSRLFGQSSPLPFQQKEDKVLITAEGKRGDTQTVVIYYRGIPTDGLIISKNKWGERTFFGDNWPDRAHQWLPCMDRPDDKASVEFIVTAPDHYKVVSNGIKLREQALGAGLRLTHWKEETPIPTKVMVVGVARFAVKQYADSSIVPTSAWVYPQDSTKGFYDYALAADIVKFFSRYIGPYPFKKLANVQSKTVFGGMENASAIFYAENSVTGDRQSEALVAHEIAHQWFGNTATEKSFAHVWLSEGFASYLTHLYIEKNWGRDSFLKRMQADRQAIIRFAINSKQPVVDTVSKGMELLNTNSYQKGSWVLHMLRQQVGDSVFQKIIQTYYQQYKGKNADSKDFQTVAEKVSGKDLTLFFYQWLHQPGVPQLSLILAKTNEGLQLTVVQLQPDLYQLTLPLSIESRTVKEKKMLLRINERMTVAVLSPDKEAKVQFDPDSTLLFENGKR